jgi:hypothetical protein
MRLLRHSVRALAIWVLLVVPYHDPIEKEHDMQNDSLADSMRRLGIGLAVLLLAMFAWWQVAEAQPFIISDAVDARATHCGFKYGTAARVDVPVGTNAAGAKICKDDIGPLAAGTYTVNATALYIDPVQGRPESAPSTNFTFDRLAPPAAPAGMRLSL